MRGLEFDMPLAIVDVETTGSSPPYARVLEIGIIRIEQGKIVETLNTVLDPECSVPTSIFSLTGIHPKEITSAPTFNDVFKDIERLLSGAVFVAHNAQFDYSFIKSEYKRLGKRFSAKRLCTVALSRKLFPKYSHHDLSSIIDRCGFMCEARHRAFADAKVLVDFLNYAHKTVGEKKFNSTVEKILSRNSVPPAISSEIIDALPETSGVYIFYGEDGEKLYIGKSVNIRKRVLSHFTGDGTHKSIKIAQEVRDIETIETHGELGALLLESELVKKEQPLLNRMLRHARKLIAAEEYKDSNGYKRVRFTECNMEISDAESLESILEEKLDKNHENFLGLFKSHSHAKKTLRTLSEENKLCPVLLGLEKHSGKKGEKCFSAQIEKCSGACAGIEDALIYNSRFDHVFNSRRIKTWPYSGAIVIEEKGSEANTGTVFIVDEWRLIKSFTYDEYGNEKEFLGTEEKTFNYDSYKILASYILKNPKKIRPLNSHQRFNFNLPEFHT